MAERTVSARPESYDKIKNVISVLTLLFSTVFQAAEATSETTAEYAPIRSVSEALRLHYGDFKKELPFEFRGTVLTRADSGTFIIDDGSASIKVNTHPCIAADAFATGDRVIVGGLAEHTSEFEGKNRLIARAITVTGKGTVPKPVDAALADITAGRFDYRIVRVKGTVTAVFQDEIDPRVMFLTLLSGSTTIPVTFHRTKPHGITDPLRLLDAQLRVTGVCEPSIGSWRIFQGHGIATGLDCGKIEIISPSPADPFDIMPLDVHKDLRPDHIPAMGRRSVAGLVSAVWGGNNVLLRTDIFKLKTIRVHLATGQKLPKCGAYIRVAGLPETDLFTIILSNAIWRDEPANGTAAAAAEAPPVRLTVEQLLFDEKGAPQLQTPYHGRVITLSGTVHSLVRDPPTGARMNLSCGHHVIAVDASGCVGALDGVELGAKVETTGVCLAETDIWRPSAPFPRVKGFSLVLRTPKDIRILARPPWFTPRKVFIVLGFLIAALAGVGIWNRMLNRIVARRGRQLLKEEIAHAKTAFRVDERTRLAAELHDSISQTLTGVSLQIDAAERARRKDDRQMGLHLATARQTLANCREELKNCLWDLRNCALEEPDAEEAIRKTLNPHRGEAELSIGFSIPRSRFSDSSFHAVLRILRELVTNAIRHGKAKHIDVRGESDGGGIVITVRDDGEGFDPGGRKGMEEGHFGLLGISERLARLGGHMKIDSAPGLGTTAVINIKEEK